MNIKVDKLMIFGMALVVIAILCGLFMFYQVDVFVHTPDPQNHPLGIQWQLTVAGMLAFAALGDWLHNNIAET
jgi:hypothetical protein